MDCEAARSRAKQEDAAQALEVGGGRSGSGLGPFARRLVLRSQACRQGLRAPAYESLEHAGVDGDLSAALTIVELNGAIIALAFIIGIQPGRAGRRRVHLGALPLD